MPRQHSFSFFSLLFEVLSSTVLLAVFAGCEHPQEIPKPTEPELGLVFESESVHLGTLKSGVTPRVSFPFKVVGKAVRVDALNRNCGCVSPELRVQQQPVSLPVVLEPGTTGDVQTSFATAGFFGLKRTKLTLVGEGPRMPLSLGLSAELERVFTLSRDSLDLELYLGESQEAYPVQVSAQTPFRLTKILAGAPGLRIEGVPSQSEALHQEFRVVLLPQQEEGLHTEFVKVQTSLGQAIVLPVRYEKAGTLWLQPASKVLLGLVQPGKVIQSAVELGVRKGTLRPPKVSLEGMEEGGVNCVTLEEGSRYKVLLRLSIPVNHPPGPLSGTLLIELEHNLDGEIRTSRHSLPVIAVVASSSSSP